MKAIMVMFDSLNRRFLEPYGCCETITPNFTRLAQHTVKFDNSYVGSLPCIPARRELHTGRYNCLHRSWGPLEPFDDSMPRLLNENGIHSHLVSDHGHYWEDGGATYHTQYSTWESFRGQEGDPWKGLSGGVKDSDPNIVLFKDSLRKKLYNQNLVNREYLTEHANHPQTKTFNAGINFINDNKERDSWFLQIESFDPHEPFMSYKEFKALYGIDYDTKRYEWPDYAPVCESEEEVLKIRYAYFSLLSMCDYELGRILDEMDRLNLWQDTMLIVNTDHGYMLGEHDFWAKNYMPPYNEIANTPLFIWDPRHPESKGIARKSFVQTIDIPPTILEYFNVEIPKDMMGQSVQPIIKNDTKVREGGLFGSFGGHLCYTDGKFVYMRGTRNIKTVPLKEYTLMPTHMMGFFTSLELSSMQLSKGFKFTKGLPVMSFDTSPEIRCIENNDLLFDLEKDPQQLNPIYDEKIICEMLVKMKALMFENDAPDDIYKRFEL